MATIQLLKNVDSLCIAFPFREVLTYCTCGLMEASPFLTYVLNYSRKIAHKPFSVCTFISHKRAMAKSVRQYFELMRWCVKMSVNLSLHRKHYIMTLFMNKI